MLSHRALPIVDRLAALAALAAVACGPPAPAAPEPAPVAAGADSPPPAEAVTAEPAPEPEPTADDDRAARAAYMRGTSAFEAGDYEQAIASFVAAHRLSQRPELLYNIGVTHERLGQRERAADAFEEFLDSGAADSMRAALEARVRRLRGLPP